MNLDEEKRKTVAQWIAQGLKLADIQNRLASELGVNLTYMDVRFLVDDLKLTPKDAERPKTTSPLTAPSPAPPAQGRAPAAKPAAETAKPTGQRPPGVSLSVDQVARPGAVASGNVSFSDGNTANWYVDQMGRLGLVPQQQGYRPPEADLQQFQTALEAELSKLGF